MNFVGKNSSQTVTVVGAGVAGMSTACALAETGMRVQLVERRGYLGGRASSYLHPGVGEVIDNCQHVLFKCCTNVLGFYRRIGVEEKIHWSNEMTMIEPGGRRSRLGPFELGSLRLPAPFQNAPSFISSTAFSGADKVALGRAMLALLRPEAMVDRGESLGDWLRRHKQTEGALNRFWRLVIASALNAEIDRIAVPYAAKVIRNLFLNSAQGGNMGMSTVPLSALYAGAQSFLNNAGSEILFNSNIEAAEWDEESSQWALIAHGRTLTSDFLVLALPFEATAKMLPKMPPAEGVDALAAQLEHHEHEPICSVHLWFDRKITDLDHAVLLDREIHWMFNKSKLQPQRREPGSYLELVISASRSFAQLSREDAIALAIRELTEFFPEVAKAKLVKAALVKEMRATFGVPPGIDAARPTAVSPWPNCFLAGDWIATGWPSTMESSALSGHLAAEAVCAAMGNVRAIVDPEMKATGLARWMENMD